MIHRIPSFLTIRRSVPFPTPYLHSILWDGPAFTVLAFLSSLYPGESIREKSGIGQNDTWVMVAIAVTIEGTNPDVIRHFITLEIAADCPIRNNWIASASPS